MTSHSLVLMACLIGQPDRCLERRFEYDAVTGTPMECLSVARLVLPTFAARHPGYRIRFRCEAPSQEARL